METRRVSVGRNEHAKFPRLRVGLPKSATSKRVSEGRTAYVYFPRLRVGLPNSATSKGGRWTPTGARFKLRKHPRSIVVVRIFFNGGERSAEDSRKMAGFQAPLGFGRPVWILGTVRDPNTGR